MTDEAEAKLKEWQDYWGCESPHSSHVAIGNSDPRDRALGLEQERANRAEAKAEALEQDCARMREALAQVYKLPKPWLGKTATGGRITWPEWDVAMKQIQALVG